MLCTVRLRIAGNFSGFEMAMAAVVRFVWYSRKFSIGLCSLMLHLVLFSYFTPRSSDRNIIFIRNFCYLLISHTYEACSLAASQQETCQLACFLHFQSGNS